MNPRIAKLPARVGLFIALASCNVGGSGGPTDPTPRDGHPVLFIGNSYLYTMDLPGIVEAMADSAGGEHIAPTTVAAPDYALIDHWHEGTARREIAKGGWAFVVLQQGPSSVEINRDTLRLATRYFAEDMAAVGARPALFSAWPTQDRRQDFPRAIESYRLAAQDVDGVLLPVAAAWLAAWARNPGMELYADGLHPSVEGAYLSALVIYARLLNQSPVGLPATLELRRGGVIALPPATAALLQEAAAEVTQPAPNP
jgi:hypothetical protein